MQHTGHSTIKMPTANTPAVLSLTTPVVDGNVTQSNRLLESAHTLNLPEKRLVLLAASQLDPHAPAPMDGTVTITAEQFARAFDVHINHAYTFMSEAVTSLFNRIIERNARWVYAAEYQPGEGKCALAFSPDVMRYLTDLRKEFTTIQLGHVGKLPTFHSVRIYELCMTAVEAGELSFTLDELRDVLNLQENYAEFRDLRRHVIDDSIEHINKHTQLKVDVEYQRQGRKVTGVRFKIDQTSTTIQTPPETA
jgi:plasmid replication initiation protein